MTTAYAPGKVILFGEHAVVYGRPAIAVPVSQVRACAVVEDGRHGQGVTLHAADLKLEYHLGASIVPSDPMYPLATTVYNVLAWLGMIGTPDLSITISSTVPIARGLGSGAAIATAMVRALAQYFGRQPSPQEVSDLVYQTEVLHHGTPSGIDNTVIAFEQPIYFIKGQPIKVLRVGKPFWLMIGDTGVASPTKIAVGDVRRAWQEQPARYEALFDQVGQIACRARGALSTGEVSALGDLMNRNQGLLRAMDVSSPDLERLIAAALKAGAQGAKLCGSGRGGNMIALVEPATTRAVAAALAQAAAANIIATEVKASCA